MCHPAAVLAQDSAGEEEEAPPPVAPASVGNLPRDQRRDSAGEMLASAAAAANAYRRPSAAESLSAARQLVSERVAYPTNQLCQRRIYSTLCKHIMVRTTITCVARRCLVT